MRKLLIVAAAAGLMMVSACGDPPLSSGTTVGSTVSVDGKIMPAERAFAVAEVGYTAVANELARLLDADKLSPAVAARIRDINRQAIPVLQAGHTAVSSVGIARAAVQLLGFRDQLRLLKGGT